AVRPSAHLLSKPSNPLPAADRPPPPLLASLVDTSQSVGDLPGRRAKIAHIAALLNVLAGYGARAGISGALVARRAEAGCARRPHDRSGRRCGESARRCRAEGRGGR